LSSARSSSIGPSTPDTESASTGAVAARFRFFVAVSPGLESLLGTELERLGIRGRVLPGGVECSGTLEDLWLIHDSSRLAESVRLRMRPFVATSFAELEHHLKRLPWHAYLREQVIPRVSVVCEKSRLYHTEAIKERVLSAVADRWRKRPLTAEARGPTEPSGEDSHASKIHVRIVNNSVQTSIDASGELLHRRGYRVHVGAAPLRETLAAAMVQLLMSLASERAFTRLWDPCCGSGTLLSEWLLTCLPSAPKLKRAFAFENWPIHSADRYADWLVRRADAPRDASATGDGYRAFGSDRDPDAISAAKHNISLAGIAQHCELIPKDFRTAATEIPRVTALATNLPYGVRLEDKAAARKLFAQLDRLLLQRPDLSPVVVVSAVSPPSEVAQRWHRAATFANGGLRVSAWTKRD
jgi:putative N6-adenine-specific DNA methylase